MRRVRVQPVARHIDDALAALSLILSVCEFF
jgi:hypothetical protein